MDKLAGPGWAGYIARPSWPGAQNHPARERINPPLAPPYEGGRLGSYKLYVKGNIGPMRPSDSDPENWVVNARSPGDPNFNART